MPETNKNKREIRKEIKDLEREGKIERDRQREGDRDRMREREIVWVREKEKGGT